MNLWFSFSHFPPGLYKSPSPDGAFSPSFLWNGQRAASWGAASKNRWWWVTVKGDGPKEVLDLKEVYLKGLEGRRS